MKDIKYKKIESNLDLDNYVSKIKSIMGSVKNVSFKVKVNGFNVYEFDKEIIVIMNVFDDTGCISAFIVGNRDMDTKRIISSINTKDCYFIRGNVTDSCEDIINTLEEFKIDDKLTDKVLLVKGLQVLEGNDGKFI